MTKVVQVDWSGGGDFCGNSTRVSIRTERSEGEGWSRARNASAGMESTAPEKKEYRTIPVLSHLCQKDFFSALEKI